MAASEPTSAEPSESVFKSKKSESSPYRRAADTFFRTHMNCSYGYTFGQETVVSKTKRKFDTTWSRVSAQCPTPPAVVHITVEVKKEQTEEKGASTYRVTKYKIEMNQSSFDENSVFEERWLDRVVSQKLRTRNLIVLGDDFTNSRLV